MRITNYPAVNSNNKQVQIKKYEEEHPDVLGKYKLPVFKLSTGEHLNPLNSECTKFRIGESEIMVAILPEK